MPRVSLLKECSAVCTTADCRRARDTESLYPVRLVQYDNSLRAQRAQAPGTLAYSLGLTGGQE